MNTIHEQAAPSIQSHNQGPASTWSLGGQAYDDISRQIASALAHCVVRFDPQPGERVLDLATGTGMTARLLAARGVDVIGIDIAAGLIEAARQQPAPARGSIRFEIGDAESLPLADGSVDGITSTFGVMFATRPEAVAGELARVCRPGGRISLTVWRSDSSIAKMFGVLRPFLPAATQATPPSPFAWGERARLAELLGKSFELTIEEGTTMYYDRNGDAAWQAFVTGYGPVKKLAEGLPADQAEALRAGFIAFHEGYRTALGIAMPREYLLVYGRRR